MAKGPHDEPETASERAAAAAMSAVEEQCKRDGVTLAHCFVLVRLADPPPDEPDSSTAAVGFETNDDILSALREHTRKFARAIDIPIP